MTKLTYQNQDPLHHSRLEYYAQNCRRLIGILKALKPGQHTQWQWIGDPPSNECTTAGCALGWAAMSNHFPGLQWTTDAMMGRIYAGAQYETSAVLNGRVESWRNAARKVFGTLANDAWDGDNSKQEVIRYLTHTAATYEKWHREGIAINPMELA